MASRITELVIDCTDPHRLANLWREVLGYVELGWEGDDLEIGPPGTGFGGPQPTIVFNRDQAPRPGKLRLHIDINPTDRDQEAELTRLLAIGARPSTSAKPASSPGTFWPTRRATNSACSGNG